MLRKRTELSADTKMDFPLFLSATKVKQKKVKISLTVSISDECWCQLGKNWHSPQLAILDQQIPGHQSLYTIFPFSASYCGSGCTSSRLSNSSYVPSLCPLALSGIFWGIPRPDGMCNPSSVFWVYPMVSSPLDSPGTLPEAEALHQGRLFPSLFSLHHIDFTLVFNAH